MLAAVCRFEDFELNPSAHRLRRKGRAVHLERIPFRLLCLLVERRGQLVTREEILERIWGKGIFISENSINTAVRKIRRALNDDADAPRFIVTVPSGGYRFEALIRAASRTPTQSRLPHGAFIGRDIEMAELRAGLADAAAGHGRLLLISGQPGIGKTRIARELAATAEASGMMALAGQCSEHDDAVPYLPFIEILEGYVERTSSPDVLRTLLGEEGPVLARLLPRLNRTLPDLPPPIELPPQQARRHLFNCFCDLVARVAREQPTLLILEDLHWADDSTLALLDHLSQRLSRLPLLVAGTYRETELTVTSELARTLENLLRGRLATALTLTGLRREEVADMLSSLSGQAPPAAIAEEFYRETEGNPFFIEELFRHLKEENRLYDSDGIFHTELRVADLDVPRSVRLVVGRRLARLSARTRRILGSAATIGRLFTFDLLEASTGGDADSLLDCLEKAERAGLIFLTPGQQPEARFRFSHELVRQTVLSDLSPPRRQRLHLDIAGAIERLYPNALSDHVNDLAHHLWQAGSVADAKKTIGYLAMAAKSARAQSAFESALRHLQKALELLKKLPESPERDSRERELSQIVLWMLYFTSGYFTPETIDATKRAAVLAEKTGDLRQLFGSVISRALAALASGDLSAATALADQALELARSEGSSANLGFAHAVQIATRNQRGDLAGAEQEFTAGLAFFDDSDFKRLTGAAVAALGWAGFNAWMLGRTDVARERMARMMAAANRNNPYDLALSECFSALFLVNIKEYEQAEASGSRAFELSEKNHFQQIAALCLCILGRARAQLGYATEGIGLIRRGIAGLLQTGPRHSVAHYTVCLAAAQEREGAIVDALETVEKALQMNPGEAAWRLEALRLHGELRLKQGQTELAEADFRKAIELAQKIGAKAWELPAKTSLARLLRDTGRRDEARTMLAEIYSWFTEGFDTADLKDAKALLDELAG